MKHVRDETLVSNLKKKEREVGMRGAYRYTPFICFLYITGSGRWCLGNTSLT